MQTRDRYRYQLKDRIKTAIKEDNLENMIAIFRELGVFVPSKIRDIDFALMNAQHYAEWDYNFYKDAVHYLLKKGADTALLYFCNNIDVARIFLMHGANINNNTHHGGTFLHAVLQKRNLELINFALENGADIYLKNSNGQSPLQCIDASDPLIKDLRVRFENIRQRILCFKSQVQIIFLPYVINSNQQKDFFSILASQPCLTEIRIDNIKNDSCKNCILWVNKFLKSKDHPSWLTSEYKLQLQNFVNRLINKLYPNLLENINKICEVENYTLVMQALLLSAEKFGLASVLNSIIDLYESGILNLSYALKIQSLQEKTTMSLSIYQKFGIQVKQLTEEKISEIRKLIQPLHQSLMSLSGDYQKTSYTWINMRIEKFSDINEFPVKDKIRRIYQEKDWLTLSLGAKKDSRGNQRSLQVLHEACQKRESSDVTMTEFCKLKLI